MKRIIALLITLILICALSACGDGASSNTDASTPTNTNEIQSNTTDTTLKENTESTDNSTNETSNSTENNTSHNNNIDVEKIKSIVKDEIATNVNVDDIVNKVVSIINEQNKFVPNTKLTCVAGDNFKLPINGQKNQYADITNFSATKYKIADINNKSDYWGEGNMIYFSNYLYKIKFNGKVDPQFAGKQIYINLQFENYNEFFGAGGCKEKVLVSSDGTFSFDFIAHSNKNENVIIPHSAYINASNY